MPTVFEHAPCGSTEVIATTWYLMNSWTRAVDMFGDMQYMVAPDSGDPPLDTVFCLKCNREIGWDEINEIDEQQVSSEWTGNTQKG